MSARTPLLDKTPFVLDPRPLTEASSPHAGLLATSRAFRALGLPGLIAANLPLRQRNRGYGEGQVVESLVLLQTLGGECPEDIRLLTDDPCIERGLGYAPPKVTALREFLERFHDEALEALRPGRAVQKSFILPGSEPIQALQQVLTGAVRRIAQLYAEHGQAQRSATVDQDATIIESHKAAARPHYEGGHGYQPMLALWAEADLVLADEFRDGNVPARQAPLTCALPAGITARYFRGDSACHETDLVAWLTDPQRAAEPGGRIGFAISAFTSVGLTQKSPTPRGRPSPQSQMVPCASGRNSTTCRPSATNTRTAGPCAMWVYACSRPKATCSPTAAIAATMRCSPTWSIAATGC